MAMNTGSLSSRLAKFVVLSLFGFSISANGADYSFDLSLASIYTNNLALEPSEIAESQWLNAILPQFYLTQSAPRYDVTFSYQPQALFYANRSELNDLFHQFYTTGEADLAADKLFFRGIGRVAQVNVNPEGRVGRNNVYRTGNRSNVLGWQIGPLWESDIFQESDIQAHYYVGQIKYSDASLQDVDTQEAELSLGSDTTASRSLTYDYYYRYRNYDYENTGPVKFQRTQFELGYFTNQSLQLVGIAGLESNLAKNDGSLDEPFWLAGVRSWFGANRVEAFYGVRFFGPTYWVTWERVMEKSQLLLTYREEQQTDESAAIDGLNDDSDSGRDPGSDPGSGISSAADSTIDRPGSGNRSLNKEFRINYRFDLYRTNFDMAVFWRDRDQISATPLPGNPQNSITNDTSFGGQIELSWSVAAKTTLSAFGRWTNRDFDVQDDVPSSTSDLYEIDGRARFDIGVYTELSLIAGYQTQQGEHSNIEFDEAHAAIRLKRYILDRRSGR